MDTINIDLVSAELIKKGYEYAQMLHQNGKSLGIIPYPALSAPSIGYCQAIIELSQQAIKLYTVK